MKYILSCCGRLVDVDNKPIWCIKCGRHDIDVKEFKEGDRLPCPFCGGVAGAECLSSIDLYWYECVDCGGASGSGADWHEATKLWNMRK